MQINIIIIKLIYMLLLIVLIQNPQSLVSTCIKTLISSTLGLVSRYPDFEAQNFMFGYPDFYASISRQKNPDLEASKSGL